MLTRSQMERIIAEGGSVLIQKGEKSHRGGIPISRLEDMPTEAELAEIDPDARTEGVESLRRKKAELESRLAELEAAPPVGSPPAVEPPKEPPRPPVKATKD